MPVPMIRAVFDVRLASGTDLVAIADQRDYARLEAAEVDQPALAPGKSHSRARYLAWSALHRTGMYAGTWPTFNDTDAVDVQIADDESEGKETVPPGPGGTSDAT
jgi:hypothetical protein